MKTKTVAKVPKPKTAHLNSAKAKKVAKAAVTGHSGFDYRQIEDAAVRERAELIAAEIKANLETVGKAFLDNGRKLLAIKNDLGHGQFLSWLASEFEWSERTANNYMSVAQHFGDEFHVVSYLPSQTIYRLASKSVCQKVRTKVIAAAKSDKRLTADQVEAALGKTKTVKLHSPPKQIEGEVVPKAPDTSVEPSSCQKAAERLVQLIAPENLQEFMRLANIAGISLSAAFLQAAIAAQKSAA
ncbi:DUF3102 domain-containing protein [Mesorhizobium sp. 131-2-1]|uniref:DUF3102 domain-containing protein n=1 Tax=Mesorhizobium sp. 131-2-1 TaxID=2744518 RepID=UPI00192534A6|nr:DUF3102 domain-containing protein [Mesorhizobium sp. 131-2-1]BCG92590.1 hypothetical protein MesoLj131a_14540 [Mesorhizobium sp. 131-2-1]